VSKSGEGHNQAQDGDEDQEMKQEYSDGHQDANADPQEQKQIDSFFK
jgi:hypothetical protein